MKGILKLIGKVIADGTGLLMLYVGGGILVVCLCSPKIDVGVIKADWGIELSYGYKTIEDLDPGPSFHGHRFRFHLFQYHQEKKLDDVLNGQSEPNQKFESEVKEILNDLQGNQYLNLFEKDYQYFYLLRDDEMFDLYIIWVIETNEIAVFENII